jgi:GTP-binding protein Era
MSERADPETSKPFRCGYVALAGKPNVGKSTLLNALVGEHLSIVSPKAQTTRERVTGILTTDHYQILFVDGPGLLEPTYALQEAMRLAALTSISDADIVTYVVDATRPDTLPAEDSKLALGGASKPVIVAVNKSDLMNPTSLASLERAVRDRGFDGLCVSAATGEGLGVLLNRLAPLLPESPPLFPSGDTATETIRFFAEEFVRETALELFHDEIPYSIICRVDEFRESQDPVYVRVNIYVERESQKGIVIGVGGGAIKKVGEQARRKIEELIDARVYLELRVKVIPKWSRKPDQLKRLGFRLPPQTSGGQTGR